MADKEAISSTQNLAPPVQTPAIRFKGFSEEWKEKEIGNVLMEVKRPIELKDSALYQLVTVKRRNQGVVPRGLLKGVDILVKTYFVIRAGDYLISKRQVVHGANGIVPKSLDNAVVSNEYLVVIDSDDITAKFWTAISKRNEMYKMFFISSYGVDIEKLVFDVTDWKKRVVTLPKLTEQRRITDYLQQLDTLITQHQKKHDKLLNLKKSLLAKMFPKQGTDKPEIRFKSFSGVWEKKMLNEICSYRTSLLSAGDASIQGKYKLYDAQKAIGLTNCNIQYSDYITIVKDGAGVGRVRLLPKNTSFIGTMGAIHSKKSDIQFLLCTLKRIDFGKYISGSTIPHVYFSNYGDDKCYVPSIIEQTKIGSLFKQLDTLINQHQTQLKKLDNIKQACLAKMFV